MIGRQLEVEARRAPRLLILRNGQQYHQYVREEKEDEKYLKGYIYILNFSISDNISATERRKRGNE